MPHTPYTAWLLVSQFTAPFLVEFIGTFFLVLAVAINVTSGNPLGGISIGATLMVSVFLGGHISGAYYNPAVTFAVYITRRGKLTTFTALLYILVQVLASILAAFLAWAILDDTFHPAPGEKVSDFRAGLAEAFWTFLLATVVLQTGTTRTQAGNSFFGLAIGFTVAAGAIALGGISGGVFNPAVGTGPAIVDAIHHHDANRMKFIWLYWLAPMIGGFFAGIIFWFTNYNAEYTSTMDEEAGSLFTADHVQNLGDRSAAASQLAKRLEHQIEDRLHLPIHRNRSDTGDQQYGHSHGNVKYVGTNTDEEHSESSFHDSQTYGKLKPKRAHQGQSMFTGDDNIPTLGDKSAEASQNTKRVLGKH